MTHHTANAEVALLYGSNVQSVRIPGGSRWIVARPVPWPGRSSGEEIVAAALAHPIGSPELRHIMRAGQRVVLIVSDHTRRTGARVVLPCLLRELERGGVRTSDVCVIIASGTHRPPTPAELEAVLGEQLGRDLQVVVHDCNDAANLVSVGRTSRGTPVRCNRLATEADHVVLTGAIVPHYFAGFGGGRKSVLPGIAAWDTIEPNHLLALDPRPGHGHNPDVRAAKLAGNPVSEDMQEAADLLGPSFLINTALDEEGRICAAWAGNPREAFHRGAADVLAHTDVEVEDLADIVVASAGGTPRDDTYFQAHKALEHASYAVKSGGAVVFVAACTEGIGPAAFRRWLAVGGSVDIESRLRQGFELYGRTALASWSKTERLRVVLVSDLSADETASLGMTKVPSAQAGLEALLEGEMGEPRVCIWPEAAKSLPRLKQHAAV